MKVYLVPFDSNARVLYTTTAASLQSVYTYTDLAYRKGICLNIFYHSYTILWLVFNTRYNRRSVGFSQHISALYFLVYLYYLGGKFEFTGMRKI